jgi:hypothetical protein
MAGARFRPLDGTLRFSKADIPATYGDRVRGCVYRPGGALRQRQYPDANDGGEDCEVVGRRWVMGRRAAVMVARDEPRVMAATLTDARCGTTERAGCKYHLALPRRHTGDDRQH